MLFYFVRHGQTDANRQHLLAGSGRDIALNDEGHAQAHRLAQALLRTLPRRPGKIIASDMIRTRETAKYLSEELGLPVELNPNLREWHLGEWEGKSFAEFGHLMLGDADPAGGEMRKHFYGRVKKGWEDIHRDDEPYLIVSHGGVWMALQDVLGIERFGVKNCDLVEVKQNGKTAWEARVLPLVL